MQVDGSAARQRIGTPSHVLHHVAPIPVFCKLHTMCCFLLIACVLDMHADNHEYDVVCINDEHPTGNTGKKSVGRSGNSCS